MVPLRVQDFSPDFLSERRWLGAYVCLRCYRDVVKEFRDWKEYTIEDLRRDAEAAGINTTSVGPVAADSDRDSRFMNEDMYNVWFQEFAPKKLPLVFPKAPEPGKGKPKPALPTKPGKRAIDL